MEGHLGGHHGPRRRDPPIRCGEVGLDPEEQIFAAYGVPYQPMTFLISADKQVVDTWSGIRSEEELRAALDRLIDVPG